MSIVTKALEAPFQTNHSWRQTELRGTQRTNKYLATLSIALIFLRLWIASNPSLVVGAGNFSLVDRGKNKCKMFNLDRYKTLV